MPVNRRFLCVCAYAAHSQETSYRSRACLCLCVKADSDLHDDSHRGGGANLPSALRALMMGERDVDKLRVLAGAEPARSVACNVAELAAPCFDAADFLGEHDAGGEEARAESDDALVSAFRLGSRTRVMAAKLYLRSCIENRDHVLKRTKTAVYLSLYFASRHILSASEIALLCAH